MVVEAASDDFTPGTYPFRCGCQSHGSESSLQHSEIHNMMSTMGPVILIKLTFTEAFKIFFAPLPSSQSVVPLSTRGGFTLKDFS